MADKRFLGLGFTFAATDKGLEKKLQSVNSHLQGISHSLQTINSSGPGASKSFAGMFKNQPRQSGGTFRQASPQSQKPFMANKGRMQMPGSKHAAGSFAAEKPIESVSIRKSLLEAGTLSKASEGFVRDILKVMGSKGLVSGALEDFLRVRIDVQKKDKRITKESKLNLLSQAANFAKASGDISDDMKKLSKAFAGVGEYLQDVKSNVMDFLKTIGLDLDHLIPDELKSAGRLVASIIKPITNIPKMLVGSAKKSIADQLQANANATLMSIANSQNLGNELLTKMSAQIGGSGSATENLFAATETTAINTKPGSGKSGLSGLMGGLGTMFSKLMGFAYSLPFVGPMIKMFGEGLSFLLSPVKGLGRFLIGLLPEVELFGGSIVAAGAELLAWAAIIATAGAAIAGFGVGLYNAKEGIINFGSGLLSMASSIAGFIKASVAGIPVVEQIYSGLESLAKFIVDIPSYIMKGLTGIFDISKSFGESTGKFLGSLGDSMKKFSASVDQQTSQINQEKGISAQTSTTQLRDLSPSNTRDLKAMSIDNNASSHAQELMQRQLDASDRTNDLLTAIIDANATSSSGKNKVEISLNSKVLSAQQTQEANSTIGRSGGF